MTFLHKSAMFEQALDFTSAGPAQVNYWILMVFGSNPGCQFLATAPIAGGRSCRLRSSSGYGLAIATTMPLPKNPLGPVIRL
jgi:hypothetical protein